MTILRLGADIGSTTAKVVLLNPAGAVVFSAYRRHMAETRSTLRALLQEAKEVVGPSAVQVRLTGSAGLGLSEALSWPFVQETIAAAEVVRRQYPQVGTLLDIGGEDAKLIFFAGPDGRPAQPDIRMNGACAGGTGAFIDQMATLLNVPLHELSRLAERHQSLYPIASRCGVFAKTDIQNLLSRDARREDVAASIFRAVVLQTLATLARGRPLAPVVLFAGGPLAYLSGLRQAFVKTLGLAPGDWLEIQGAELIPAHGAALAADSDLAGCVTLDELVSGLASAIKHTNGHGRLQALFSSPRILSEWQAAGAAHRVRAVEPAEVSGGVCFLGIDSGSTTTKLVLIDEQGRLFFEHYAANHGQAIGALQAGLERMRTCLAALPQPPRVARSAVTGYGEDLIRAAFGCDEGLVETVAHFRAAQAFDPQVSFVLDIGGQDMKAIFVQAGHIQRIEINEACSSGCGSFIEAFANSLGYTVADFAQKACEAAAPCDLGTRCTVFMNSRVKQALREGAEVGDIAAGLAYSVIKNALHKVLKLTNTEVLGEHIVVQGGAFRNPAIQRALEQVLGRPVVCPDKAELMGAYGAALAARDAYGRLGIGRGLSLAPEDIKAAHHYRQQVLHCRGCENRCEVTKLTFPNANIFYTGNRCERSYSNRGTRPRKGTNLVAEKRALLFDRPMTPAAAPALTIGIPRALQLYESFPFWCTLLVECGFQVHLSKVSSAAVFQQGVTSIMSENICFPAKLLHGHIVDLIDAGVDRILCPMVFYERREFANAANCFSCPIVSGYPDVIRSAIDPAGRFGIPFDQPAISFQDTGLLRLGCREYLDGLGVSRAIFERAFALAVAAQAAFKDRVRARGAAVLAEARAAGRLVVVVAGRPYHIDPLINHKLPEALSDMGLEVITEDALPLAPNQVLGDVLVLAQWEHGNRLLHAAHWVAEQPDVELIQLNSFGCGPDALIVDEVGSILAAAGRHDTVIRVDEIDSLGSARLRLRSMLEARRDVPKRTRVPQARRVPPIFTKAERHRRILAPEFSQFCTPPIVLPILEQGFAVERLPPSNDESVQVGLRYTNNEICYPGIIVIGDVIKALQSGRYDRSEVIAGSWETGGQCRASSISCLLKKALVAAGFDDVPVVTLSTRVRSFNRQPGFRLNPARYLYQALLSMIFTDGLSSLYHAVAARERVPGQAQTLVDPFLEALNTGRFAINRANVLAGLRQAVAQAQRLSLAPAKLPKVGVVGEIYVKYNTFVNYNLAQWLIDQGLEVVLPPFFSFFLGAFAGAQAGIRHHLRRPDWLTWLMQALRPTAERLVQEADAVLREFPYHQPWSSLQQQTNSAEATVHLTHQYGEGWLLAGEVGLYARHGIPNVVCLQPFGCIANHVIAKGVARRMTEANPGLNLAFLDLDAGMSEVNFLNRLHFFADQAKRARVP